MVQRSGIALVALLAFLCCASGHGFKLPFPKSSQSRAIQLQERVESTGADGYVEVNSLSFPKLRAKGAAFVDKTSALADLLCQRPALTFRAFFARPRKFGKSLTLDIISWMLAAGELPNDVPRWLQYERVDVEVLFGGLKVHDRLQQFDPSLGGLLQQPHFVIRIDLGEATSGAELRDDIMSRIADITRGAFGEAAEARVLASPHPGRALERLINEVPAKVPVAVLVDEYDAAIVGDVERRRWEEAQSGIDALRSLLMVSKSPIQGPRIEHFVVTGVARFARTSLFSGANTFRDLTDNPLLSAAIGFSEKEIRATFGPELERLGRVGTEGRTADDALHELARWYNGYCFDKMGMVPCFNPYLVLVALREGELTAKEMEGASGTNWLGLTPADISRSLVDDVLERRSIRVEQVNVDLADLQTGQVDVLAFLLQVGLLTISRKPSTAAGVLMCMVPNLYARQSLMEMLASAWPGLPVAELAAQLVEAIRERDQPRFEDILTTVLYNIPDVMLKAPSNTSSAEAKQVIREAPYHVGVWLPLFLCLPRAIAHVEVEYLLADRIRPDVVLELLPVPPHRPLEEVWIIEVGVQTSAENKLQQARDYANHPKFRGRDGVCFACVIKEGKAGKKGKTVEWTRAKLPRQE